MDLFHRLSVFPLSVPSLRERRDDIVLLAGFFVEQIRNKLGLLQLSIPADTLEMLQNYAWPGNVREMKHAIERAAVLARASQNSAEVKLSRELFNLAIADLSNTNLPSVTPDDDWSQQSLQQATTVFQRELISKTLQQNKMNWSACARALDLDAGNLHRLAKRLGIK